MDILNVIIIIILLSNQAVNISFIVLWLLIFCAFSWWMVSLADLFENILVYLLWKTSHGYLEEEMGKKRERNFKTKESKTKPISVACSCVFLQWFNATKEYWIACVSILRAGSEDTVFKELIIMMTSISLGQPTPHIAQASGAGLSLRKVSLFVINRLFLSSSLFFLSTNNRNWLRDLRHNQIWDNSIN